MTNLQFWHHHGALSVPDIKAAAAWWEDVLGFTYERGRHIEAIPADMVMLQNGPLRIELFQPIPGAAPAEPRNIPDADIRTHGFKHIAFGIASIPPLETHLRAKNVDIIFVAETPRGRVMFIRDPFGNTIEFVEDQGREKKASLRTSFS